MAVAIHGAFGCNSEWSYLLTVTNGDGGDSIRNVHRPVRTSDNLAFSGRLKLGVPEHRSATKRVPCATRPATGTVRLALWGYYYADRADNAAVRNDLRQPPATVSIWRWATVAGHLHGVPTTGARTSSLPVTPASTRQRTWLQLGYHFPGTAWEIAARYRLVRQLTTRSALGAVQQLPPLVQRLRSLSSLSA